MVENFGLDGARGSWSDASSSFRPIRVSGLSLGRLTPSRRWLHGCFLVGGDDTPFSDVVTCRIDQTSSLCAEPKPCNRQTMWL
jgi:hypothetical protein